MTAAARRFWWILGGIGVVAFGVRLLNALVWRPLDQSCAPNGRCFAINGDALYSHLQGELLAQGHGFASSFAFWLFGDVQPGAGDPPLYVLYLGWVSALHGSGGLGAFLLAMAAVIAAVGLAWWLGRRFGDERRVPVAAMVTAGLATVFVLVSVLPGLGDGRHGVQRDDASTNPSITLPDGQTVARAADIDTSAVVAHRLASGLAGAVGVVLLGLVARRLAGDRAAFIAAGVAAVYPMLWINDAMVLSEALYVPMVALAMLAAYRFWDQPDVAGAVLLGGAIALAGLTRAEALLLGPLVAIPLAWGRRDQLGGLGGVAARVAVAGGACAALVVPWLGHNLARFEEPTFMTAGTGAVLSAGSCDVAYDGDFVGYYGANCFQQYVDMGWVEWPDATEEESVRDVPSREAAVRYIREHLADWPRVAAFRVGRMWQVYRWDQDIDLDVRVEGRGRGPSTLGFWMYVGLLPLAVAGLVLTKRDGWPISPLVAPALVVSLTAALSFGVTRYRVPADAALVVAAAVTLEAGWRWLDRYASGTMPSHAGTTSDG